MSQSPYILRGESRQRSLSAVRVQLEVEPSAFCWSLLHRNPIFVAETKLISATDFRDKNLCQALREQRARIRQWNVIAVPRIGMKHWSNQCRRRVQIRDLQLKL